MDTINHPSPQQQPSPINFIDTVCMCNINGMELVYRFGDAVWEVLLELSPWLLVGMVVAGLLHGLLPKVRKPSIGARWGL